MTANPPNTGIDFFTKRFLARMRPEVAASFTPEQLAAVRLAFGMRYAMDHSVDVRRVVTLPWGRFYLVLLAGRDRRAEGRSGVKFCRWLAILGGFSAIMGLLI